MPLVKQEGIVLRRRDFGETSRIAVVFTKDAGKIQVNAKGARKPKSKFGAALEPLTRVEALYYHHDNKDLYTLSETSIITSHQEIRENDGAALYGLAMAEALDALTEPEEADSALYRLLGRSLIALENRTNPETSFLHYLLHLSAAVGFKPHLFRCGGCGKEIEIGRNEVRFGIAAGVAFCSNCEGAVADSYLLKPGVFGLLTYLARSDYRLLTALSPDDKNTDKALDFILTYLRYHTGLRLKTLGAVYNGPVAIKISKSLSLSRSPKAI